MNQQLSITLPQDTYERMMQYATSKNQAIADAVVTYLEETLPILTDPTELEEANQRTLLQQEKKAFWRLYPVLQKTYQEQYVAIADGKLIDHDPNYHKLYERILIDYPNTIVWISKIQTNPLPDIVVRSPRLEPNR